jgi:hypothetical protein
MGGIEAPIPGIVPVVGVGSYPRVAGGLVGRATGALLITAPGVAGCDADGVDLGAPDEGCTEVTATGRPGPAGLPAGPSSR